VLVASTVLDRCEEVREDRMPSPARGTRALPGVVDRRVIKMQMRRK